MASISKIKLPNDSTTHTIKDSTARSNITKITNKTTKLAYGDELAIDGTDLKLLDPNDNVLSTVTLTSLPEVPTDLQNMTLKLITKGGTDSWQLDAPAILSYRSDYDSTGSAKWTAGYTLPYNIPSGCTLPFCIALDCGDQGTLGSYYSPTYYRYSNTSILYKCPIGGTMFNITEGVQSIQNAVLLGASNVFTSNANDNCESNGIADNCVLRYIVRYTLYSGTVYRMIMGLATNLNDSSIALTIYPNRLAIQAKNVNYLNLPNA